MSVASRATSGIQTSKWLARTFERPSSTGDTATKSSIGDSDKISMKHDLPNQIAGLNRMHREISGIDDLINVADGIDLIFRYRRLWTQDRMKRECNYEAKRHSPTCFGMQPNHGGCLFCCYTGYLGIFSSFLV